MRRKDAGVLPPAWEDERKAILKSRSTRNSRRVDWDDQQVACFVRARRWSPLWPMPEALDQVAWRRRVRRHFSQPPLGMKASRRSGCNDYRLLQPESVRRVQTGLPSNRDATW